MNIQLLIAQLCIYAGISSQSSWGSPDILTPDCNQTVSDLISDCKTQSYIKWHSNKLTLDHDKRTCCHIWDVVDCFHEIVQEECDMIDYAEIRDHYYWITQEIDQDTCENYQYYSTKCTIDKSDFRPLLSSQDHIDLFTAIGEPSIECVDAIHQDESICVNLVNQDYELTNDPIKPEFALKFECCITWKIYDCNLEVAKETEDCTHKEVVAYIKLSDRIKSARSRTLCEEYPYGSEQCQFENFRNFTHTI